MFLKILVGYFNESTTEAQIAARVKPWVAEMVLRGLPPTEVAGRREAMKAYLRDRKALFNQTYRQYFFVDKHPETADRFRMTYESCFQEATSGRV